MGKLMEGAQPLANAGKLEELEKLVDRALEMLGETEKVPDVYRKESGFVPGVAQRGASASGPSSAPAGAGSDSGLFHQERSTVFQIAAVSQADQSLPVFKGHLAPEAGQGVLRRRFAEGVVIDAGPELARVAESIFALAQESEEAY